MYLFTKRVCMKAEAPRDIILRHIFQHFINVSSLV